jgi:hypothetical protein
MAQLLEFKKMRLFAIDQSCCYPRSQNRDLGHPELVQQQAVRDLVQLKISWHRVAIDELIAPKLEDQDAKEQLFATYFLGFDSSHQLRLERAIKFGSPGSQEVLGCGHGALFE